MRRPVMGKTGWQYLRLVLAAVLSIAFLAGGAIAAALLFGESNAIKAAFLFAGALAGTAGCIFFFYCCLRQISPKPKAPFISTIH
jgi:zinc transporter ZupT